jgi:hypothetical protein
VHRATRYLKRALSILLVALTATGCSKAVEIPRADIDNPKYHEPASYRIRMKGWEEYLVKRFTVTDSTIVIEELMPSDERYRFKRSSLPIEVPRDDVTSIAEIQAQEKTTFAVVAVTAIAIATLISWAITGISLE